MNLFFQKTVNLKKLRTPDTLNMQAVPVQTVLLFSCAGCADSKNRSHLTGNSRQRCYALVPSMTGEQHEYLFLNLGTDGGTMQGIQGASLNH